MTKLELQSLINKPVKSIEPFPGGSMTENYQGILESEAKVFIKHSSVPTIDLTKEGRGLIEISKASSFHVPKVLGMRPNCLAIEWLELDGSPAWAEAGQALASMHKCYSEHIGLNEDNFIGQTPQKNTPLLPTGPHTWSNFFWNYRILFQINWAKQRGLDVSDIYSSLPNLQKVVERKLLKADEPASLLHGDFWSGNLAFTKAGKPATYDPAFYYGHRETDLAMSELFGGFPKEFYQAYNDNYPINDGYETRKPIYQLYHVLNHWNLFGDSYKSSALSIIHKIINDS